MNNYVSEYDFQAAVLELGCIHTTVPFSVPHKTTKDTSLLGYDIPKGTEVSASTIKFSQMSMSILTYHIMFEQWENDFCFQ